MSSAKRHGKARQGRRGLHLVLVALAATIAALVAASSTRADAQDPSGADLYAQNCAGCHQAGGVGIEGTFPPLASNPAVADPAYVGGVITNGKSGPLEVLGVQYDSVMAPVAGLSADQVEAISEYVSGLAGGDETTTSTTVATEAPTGGDADRGRDLFIGAKRTSEGTSACASCHTAGDIGNLGGSSLGPDLTDVYAKLGGEAGLSAWLTNPPAPTMTPIFGDHPLTEAEIADLVAYLAEAPNDDEPSDQIDWLLLIGFIGAVVLFAGMAVAWRGMRRTYVETLRSAR
ncbi:MAG: c-type cytochrome [Actinomycetia bacterium]|nr:c-type cytochrome [Actinomycetes bacterium]MCP4958690.1 c-type cytochrome [Actinomycetes bacterium]